MLGTVGSIGAELTGDDFWRGAGVGATIGLLNHYTHQIEGDLAEKRAFKQKHSLDGMSLATGVAGVSLGNFDDAGNYLHITNKTRRLKFYNRPYVNQHTTNLKVGVRGGALLFGINQFSAYNDYQNGRINSDQLEIQSLNNILGSVSPQMGLMFLSYDIMKFANGMINKFLDQPQVITFFNKMNSEIDYFMDGASYSGFDN
ncbi:hypothetical protein L3073_14035 [Ancylomarina sp. DW003]|nr:hypothetical protein [Ancylomarina sp. DW003]MDE5423335.1 hypothetical protein [Ancylomarina sp. DW003]